MFLLIQGLRAAVFLLIQGLRTDVFLLIQGLRTDLACYLISVLVALLHRRYTCQLLYVIARTRPRKSRKMSPASRVAEVLQRSPLGLVAFPIELLLVYCRNLGT